MTKNRFILAGAAIVAIVAIPMFTKAGRGAGAGLSEEDSLRALKKKHDCIRAAWTDKMKALDGGWSVHRSARSDADQTYARRLSAADVAFRACTKDEETCEEERGAVRRQARKDLHAARAASRQAWSDIRRETAADYKTSKKNCGAKS